MKKFLVVALVASGVGLVVFRQVGRDRAAEDLWTEATNAPDLR